MDGLSPIERKKLKARAHALNPIAHIGGKGLTEPVIAEIGRALDAHELIKVRAGSMERDGRAAALVEICTRLGAQPVQHIGKVFVLYREKAEDTQARLSRRRADGQT
jgi:putative YhbY family RNA-binding protein